jgi:tetratricopeptide (TPR) repeat protein
MLLGWLSTLLVFTDLQAQVVNDATPQVWRDSLAQLNAAIRLYPRSTDLRLKKAAVNIELGQWDYAAEEYSRVLEIDEHNLAALFYRAYVHVEQHRYDLARADYERFLTLVPKNFEAQLGLATVKRKLRRQADAMDELNRLVQLFPDSALAYAARADYEASLGQYEIALYDWDEALKRRPGDLSLTLSRIDVLIALRRHDEAWHQLQLLMKQGVHRSQLKPWIDRCK